MKQALALLALVSGGLMLAAGLAGFATVLTIAYGAISLMAFGIAATFLWLWLERATPLALGMVFSWLGSGLVTGWWWLFHLSGARLPGAEGLLLCLAFSFVGALLHFAVIHRSFGRHGIWFLWPVGGAFAVSLAVSLLG